MTNEERDLIARFIARVGGSPQASGTFLQTSGSVPASQPPLPSIDREADAFIGQQFQQYPDARYRITQTAVVQEAALAEASNTIQRLQWELDQARQAMQQQQAQAPQQNRGFFGNLFGGGQQPQRPPGAFGGGPQQGPWGQQGGQQGGQPYQYSSAPPQPQYPPNYQPGMFQRGGSGFLGSALTTAAGVAGGMVVGNALMNAFSGHGGGVGGGGWGSSVSNPSSAFDSAGVIPGDPTSGFGSNAGFADPYAAGGADKGGFDQASAEPSQWDQAGGDWGGGGGGFDGGGGSFDDNG